MAIPSQFLAETRKRCQMCSGEEECDFCGGTGIVTVDPFLNMDTTPMTGLQPEIKAFFGTVVANMGRAKASGHPLEAEQVSPAEMALAAALDRAGITDYEQQVQVGRYFTDFYFPDCDLAVEVDGAEWHTDVERDRRRTRSLLKNGVRDVLRLQAARVFNDAARCVEEITAARARLA